MSDDIPGGTVGVRDPPDRSLEDDVWPSSVGDALAPVVGPATDGALPPAGASTVLVTGAIGTGKTRLAHAVLGDLDVPVVVVPPDAQFEQPATALQQEVFDEAFATAPAAVLFDDFGTLAGHALPEVQAVLERNLERASRTGEVAVVATVDELAELDRSLRRPGRFDVLCPLELPDQDGRAHVLATALERVDGAVAVDDERRAALVDRTEGFTPADVHAAVRRAAAARAGTGDPLDGTALRAAVDALDRDLARDADDDDGLFGDTSLDSYYAYDENLQRDEDGDDPVEFTWAAGDDEHDGSEERAHMAVQRAGDVPEVSYDDIGGLDDEKRILREAVEWPTEHPDLCEAMGLDHARGILLHGPPGNGKTMLAKAIANETDSRFISVKGPEVMDKYVGESEKFVDRLFAAARELAPSVVFIDEVDSITDERGGDGVEVTTDRVVNQLLLELDGLGDRSEVVVIGATNRPDIIDDAIRRPGRLGKEIHVPPPDDDEAGEIFEVHLRDRPLADDVSPDWLVERSEDGVSGAEIAAICEEAARSAMRRRLDGEDDPAAGDGTTEPDGDLDDAGVRIRRADFERALDLDSDAPGRDDVTAFQ